MQFSIKQLMAWTVVVAMACAVLFAVPSIMGAAILGLGLLWLPVLLVCGVIYARGWRRTFFIGAMIAAAPFLVPLLAYVPMLLLGAGLTSIDLEDLTGESAEAFTPIKFAIATFFAYVGGTGFVALFSRWLVSPREPTAKSATTNSGSPPQYAVLQGRFSSESLPRSE
jgi:hypothetical protein